MEGRRGFWPHSPATNPQHKHCNSVVLLSSFCRTEAAAPIYHAIKRSPNWSVTTDFNVLSTLKTSINPFDCYHRRDFVPGLRLRYTPNFPVDCTASTSDRERKFGWMRKEWSSRSGTNQERNEGIQKKNRCVSMFRILFIDDYNTRRLKSNRNLNH